MIALPEPVKQALREHIVIAYYRDGGIAPNNYEINRIVDYTLEFLSEGKIGTDGRD